LRISSLQIEEVLTAPRSPWQNPYVERLIGSTRRDCLDHFIIFNARHLKRTLRSYFTYYQGSRTHLGLDKQCPHVRPVSSVGTIVQIPHLSACITVTNARQRNAMPADAFLANDAGQKSANPTAHAPQERPVAQDGGTLRARLQALSDQVGFSLSRSILMTVAKADTLEKVAADSL
jgi:hypothetical protein